jgi:hypothetical protein
VSLRIVNKGLDSIFLQCILLFVRLLKASPLFYQAAVSSIERCALFLFRYLEFETQEQLSGVLHQIHRELKVPFPRYEILDCRDWPTDSESGKALSVLLKRLGEIENMETK